MKKLIYVLISSLTTVTLCISLIVASTFALFTSKSDVNIAMSYGKVKIIATVENLEAVSAKWNAAGYYEYVKPSVPGRFAVGGTYEYDSPNLTLTNIVPGDGVDFVIKIKNESTVDIKYETVITVAGDDMDLFDALEIKVNDADIDKMKSTAVSEWQQAESGAAISDIKVSIKLPIDDTNPIVDEAVADSGDTSDGTVKQCKLVIGVYAVQANGEDNKYSDVYFISKNSDWGEVLNSVDDGDTVVLAENVTVAPDNPLKSNENSEVVIDVAGHSLSAESSSSGNAIVVGANSKVTLTDSAPSENSGLVLNSKTSRNAMSVSGTGAEVTVEDVKITCDNSNTSNASSISVKSGGTFNFGDGAELSFNDERSATKYPIVSPNEAYGIKAEGRKSTVNINGGTINADGWGAAVMADNGATVNMTGGVINVSGTDGSFGLSGGYSAIINMTGGVINVTGDLTGGKHNDSNQRNTAAAIGEYKDGGGACLIIVTGGVINLTPTAGRAFAFSTIIRGGSRITCGGDLVINVNAGEGAEAAAFAIGGGSPAALYENVKIYDGNGEELSVTNKTNPGERNFRQWIDDFYDGEFAGLVDRRPSQMP